VTRARLLWAAPLLTAAAVAVWPTPVLTVTTAPPARVLVREALSTPVEVRLQYVHSVERTPVAEYYLADRRGLRLVRMEFAAQGAGMPSGGYVREGDHFVLRTDRLLATLVVRVSGTGQRLWVGEEVFDLTGVTGEGGTVTVAVRASPRLPFLRGMLY